MVDLVKDMSTLTTLSEKTINKFFKKISFCIAEAVHEAKIKGEELTEINIGFGTLYIKNDPDNVKYKFIPSNELDDGVKNTLKYDRNILEDVLNEALAKKFAEVYKDLC